MACGCSHVHSPIVINYPQDPIPCLAEVQLYNNDFQAGIHFIYMRFHKMKVTDRKRDCKKFCCLRKRSTKLGISYGIVSTLRKNFIQSTLRPGSPVIGFYGSHLGGMTTLEFSEVPQHIGNQILRELLHLQKPCKQNGHTHTHTHKEINADLSTERCIFLTFHHKIAEHLNISSPFFCSRYHFSWNIKQNGMFIHLLKGKHE